MRSNHINIPLRECYQNIYAIIHVWIRTAKTDYTVYMCGATQPRQTIQYTCVEPLSQDRLYNIHVWRHTAKTDNTVYMYVDTQQRQTICTVCMNWATRQDRQYSIHVWRHTAKTNNTVYKYVDTQQRQTIQYTWTEPQAKTDYTVYIYKATQPMDGSNPCTTANVPGKPSSSPWFRITSSTFHSS